MTVVPLRQGRGNRKNWNLVDHIRNLLPLDPGRLELGADHVYGPDGLAKVALLKLANSGPHPRQHAQNPSPAWIEPHFVHPQMRPGTRRGRH